MKQAGFIWALLAALAVTAAIAGQSAPVGKATITRPRLGRDATLEANVQNGDALRLTLFDPGGNQAYLSADSSVSNIPDCEGESWSVDDATDATGTAPSGLRFLASRPEVGVWRLEAVLPREATEPTSFMLDAHIDTCSGITEDLTLKPGHRATWLLKVLSTGDIQNARAAVTPLTIRSRRGK